MARTKKRSNKTSRKSQTQVISELRKKVRKLVKENKMLRSKMGGGGPEKLIKEIKDAKVNVRKTEKAAYRADNKGFLKARDEEQEAQRKYEALIASVPEEHKKEVRTSLGEGGEDFNFKWTDKIWNPNDMPI